MSHDLNLNFKYVSADEFTPKESDQQIKGWNAIIESGVSVGKVEGYLIDEDGGIHYATVLLDELHQNGTEPEIILFPFEEVEPRDNKEEVLLEAITEEFLALYPRYTPGEELTVELEKRMRQFFTGGYSKKSHFSDVIKKGRRTTMRHGPLNTDRGIMH